MELSHTSYVLLGTLSFGPRTGYSIKALLDQSVRFFWATSYSQIYPELKRLAERGLVEGHDTTEGGRKRIEYRITEDGEAALKQWLKRPPETFEMRDEGLLKLFFAGAGTDEDALNALAAIRRRRREMEEQLRSLEQGACGLQPGNPYPDIVRRAGVEFFRLFAEWCSKTELELMEEVSNRATTASNGTPAAAGSGTDPIGGTPDV